MGLTKACMTDIKERMTQRKIETKEGATGVKEYVTDLEEIVRGLQNRNLCATGFEKDRSRS